MKHITPRHMIGFNDELSKEAGRVGSFLKGIRGFASDISPVMKRIRAIAPEMKGRHGRQLALGSGVGAVGGAAVADPEEGESRLRGALKGALLGGAVTGGGILTTKAGREAAKKGTSHFLQRQRYGMTGRGLGSTPAEELAKAREIGLVRKATPGMSDKALKEIASQEHALRKGYMSVPGVAHAMMSRDAPDLARSAWRRSGMLGKGFAGLGAYETVKGFSEKPEPGGPGRLEKGMRGLGSTVGWMVAPQSLLAGHLVGEGLGKVTGSVGKGADAVRQHIKNRRLAQNYRAGRLAPAQYSQYPQYRGG